MDFDDMRKAVNQAKGTINIADSQVGAMVELVAGRLRKCNASTYYLKKLKLELRNFNAHTGSWRD